MICKRDSRGCRFRTGIEHPASGLTCNACCAAAADWMQYCSLLLECAGGTNMLTEEL